MSKSSSSGSSPESSSTPASIRKRKQDEAESSESSDGRNSSDASSADEEDSDAPQPPSPTKDIIVLSHAERRRQKKRQNKDQLAAASPRKKRRLDGPDARDSPPSSRVHAKAATKPSVAADDPRRQKRQNSVWVGNLSFRTTEDALRRFLGAAGTITRVHMPMRRGAQTVGENMGFAYVDFETPEAKVVAITLSEGHLDGRKLLIKDGDDFTGRPLKAKTELTGGGEGEKLVKNATMTEGKTLSKQAQKILRAQKQPPAPTLFLGNLGFETTEGSIRELFEAHRYFGRRDDGKGARERDQGAGEDGDGAAKSKDVWIRKIRVGTFEDSGACKGFAFVDFTSIEHATEALVNSRNHHLDGRDLVVEYASADAVRRGGGARNSKGDQDRKRRAPQKGQGPASAPYIKPRQTRHTEQAEEEGAAETPAEATVPRTGRTGRPDRGGHDRPHTRRARPGAALADAQRQSAAILPSQGQKIVF